MESRGRNLKPRRRNTKPDASKTTLTALREMLHRHDPALSTLTLRLRDIVIRAIAPCHEYIYAMKWRVVLFYGTSEKIMNDGVCAIVVYKKFINLGFPRGVDLDDPTGALEGTGVGFRHISVKTP